MPIITVVLFIVAIILYIICAFGGGTPRVNLSSLADAAFAGAVMCAFLKV